MPAGVSSAAVKSCREFVEVYDFLRDRANDVRPLSSLLDPYSRSYQGLVGTDLPPW